MNGNGTILRSLVDLRDRTLQKNRVAFGLRIDAVDNLGHDHYYSPEEFGWKC